MWIAALGVIYRDMPGAEGANAAGEVLCEAPCVAEFSDADEGDEGALVELEINGRRYWLPEAEFTRLRESPLAIYRGTKRGEPYTLRIVAEVPAAAQDALRAAVAIPAPCAAEERRALAACA